MFSPVLLNNKSVSNMVYLRTVLKMNQKNPIDDMIELLGRCKRT